MQALKKTAVATLARSACVACPRPSTSRALATVADIPYSNNAGDAGGRAATSTSSRTTAKRKTNAFVVPPPSTEPRPKAPRYSKNSSRVKGRTPNRPRKMLNQTALDSEGVNGQFQPSEQGEIKIYLPSVFMRLVRNTGVHKDDPYTATFRTDLRLTKPDISNYLKNVYGLGITSMRTMNYLSKMKRNPIGGGYSRSGGTKSYKKVLVGLTEPFWYPQERSREWCNEHFERDRMEELRDRKMLKIGDGRKQGVSAQRYRGAHKSRAEIERLAKIAEEGGADLTKTDGSPSDLKRPMGLRKSKNVIRSRAERQSEYQTKIEQEMERLRLDADPRASDSAEIIPPKWDAGHWVDLMQQLNELFASYAQTRAATAADTQDGQQKDGTSNQQGGPLAAPLSALPELIDAFEQRRKVELLTAEEKDKVREFASSGPPDLSITIDDFIGLLQNVGAASTIQSVLPVSPSPLKQRRSAKMSLSLFTPDKDKFSNADGASTDSPLDHRRPASAQDFSQLKTGGREPPTPTKLSKKRSLLSLLAASPRSASAPPPDVSELLISRGDLYLGVPLEGPFGRHFDAESEADKLRSALRGAKDKEIAAVVGDKTFAQIREIDRAFQRKFDKRLIQAIQGERSLKGNIEFALRGLVLGPLDFDVFLLRKALAGSTKNDSLLIELLVGRPPATVALLRAAYRSAVHEDPAVSARYKTLEDALMAHSGTNARLKRAWELVLQARWTDLQREGDESPPDVSQNQRLQREDLDQLKVSLRKGGNSDAAVRILLSRSPEHLRTIMNEYRRSSASSLPKAIKQVFNGALLEMLLFTIENVKHEEAGTGVWRDAKRLWKTMEVSGSRDEALSRQIIRLHWDRERFLQVQQAFRRKYGKALLERIARDSSSQLRELLRVMIVSSDKPLPSPSEADEARLNATRAPSRASSTSSKLSLPASDTASLLTLASDRRSLLEGDGEMSEPEPDAADKMLINETPPEPSSSEMQLSSSLDSALVERPVVKTHRTSSSMDYRRRSSPLDTSGPGSSASSVTTQLRHSRPMAPSRRRQSSNKDDSRATSPRFARSPTPTGSTTDASFTSALASSRGSTASTLSPSSQLLADNASAPTPSSDQKAVDSAEGPKSPIASIDNRAYHAPPISPVKSSFPRQSLDDSPASINSLLPFDLATPSQLGFDPDTPERSYAMRRDGSTASQRSFTTSTSGGSSKLFLDNGSIGFGSPAGGREGESFQSLLRHASELAKKLKGAETRLEASSTAFEREVSELEGRLEEARAELQAKRREEKELKIIEKQHLNQILSLEADVTKLQKSLDKSRESFESMKKSYTAQCDEAEKLRALVAETRRDFQAAEDAAQSASLHSRQLEQDKQMLEQTIAKLESDIEVARKAESALSDQKQENLVLKETIDRLRFDLEEMRAASRKSGFLDPAAINSGNPLETPSMSKSLGNELARKLAADESGQDKDEQSSGSETEGEVDDIVVTTHRRIKKMKRATSSRVTTPTVTHVERTVVVADAETQTDKVQTSEIQVQTDAILVSPKTSPAMPAKISKLSPRAIASQLGVEVSALEDLIDASRHGQVLDPSNARPVEGFGLVQARRASRWAGRIGSRAATQGPALLINVLPESAKPYLAPFVESSLTFFLYSTTLYLFGVLSGAWLSPFAMRPSSGPLQSAFSRGDFASYAWSDYPLSLPLGAGMAREGVAAFVESMIWGGVTVSRRLPT
ncbi:hypothetical protein OIO90_000834 [Microbotryomycetes sp. JL221]|nr:hypothetical protein OIO90_000834 [Microbotryomycetes sp. JL221]